MPRIYTVHVRALHRRKEIDGVERRGMLLMQLLLFCFRVRGGDGMVYESHERMAELSLSELP